MKSTEIQPPFRLCCRGHILAFTYTNSCLAGRESRHPAALIKEAEKLAGPVGAVKSPVIEIQVLADGRRRSWGAAEVGSETITTTATTSQEDEDDDDDDASSIASADSTSIPGNPPPPDPPSPKLQPWEI